MHFILSSIILFVTMFTASATSIHLEGYIPENLNTTMLQREYHRICTMVELKPENNLQPLTIYFYRHSEKRKTGIKLPEWGGGGALGNDSIVIPIDRTSAFYRANIEQIILHEMVHIALSRAYGTLRVPRWFHEGMAMTLSGDLDFEEQLLLSRAIITRSLISLDSIEQLNRFSQWRARVAYSQSHFAVRFLLDTYGYDLIPELLKATRKTRQFDSACFQVFGLTQKELETLLRKEMAARYRLFFLVGDHSLFWIGIVLLAFVAFIVTRFRNRKKRQQLEEEEKNEDIL